MRFNRICSVYTRVLNTHRPRYAMTSVAVGRISVLREGEAV